MNIGTGCQGKTSKNMIIIFHGQHLKPKFKKKTSKSKALTSKDSEKIEIYD